MLPEPIGSFEEFVERVDQAAVALTTTVRACSGTKCALAVLYRSELRRLVVVGDEVAVEPTLVEGGHGAARPLCRFEGPFVDWFDAWAREWEARTGDHPNLADVLFAIAASRFH